MHENLYIAHTKDDYIFLYLIKKHIIKKVRVVFDVNYSNDN
jgi:hypothetical protein